MAQHLGLDSAPAPQTLWISTRELRAKMESILGHPLRAVRYAYWRDGHRTLWVINETGKTEDITFGFEVQDDHIKATEVLAFRETRGWEIRAPWFTRQFKGAKLKKNLQLDRSIDIISGASLSVAAYERSARLVLLLHQQVMAAVDASPPSPRQ